MARKGGAGAYLATTNSYTLDGAFTACLSYRNSGAAGTGSTTRALNIRNATASFDAGIYWHNTTGGREQSFFSKDSGGTYHYAQIPTVLAADTWYRIVLLHTDLLAVWIDGTLAVLAASPGPAPPWTFTWTNPLSLTALADSVAGSQYDTGGTVAEIALWEGALSQGEIDSLGRLAPPLLVKPAKLKAYLPAVREVFDPRGEPITVTGTTVQPHCPAAYPHDAYAPSGTATLPVPTPGTGPAAATYGVFGPRTQRTRVALKYQHLAERWGRVVGESMNKTASERLGQADSGHIPQEFTTSLVLHPFIASDLTAVPVGGATGLNWVGFPMGSADVRVKIRIVPDTTSGYGLGLFFRGDASGQGHLFHQDSGGNWWLSEISAAGEITHWASLGSSPALTPGQQYILEVRCLGTAVSAWVDGVQVSTTKSSASMQSNTSHGWFCHGDNPHAFDNLTVFPKDR